MTSSLFTKNQLTHWYLAQQQSTYNIARKYHCNPKTVYYWLQKYNIQIRQRKIVPIDPKEIKQLYASGLSLKEIGLRYNITASAVLKKMIYLGFARRSSWEANIIHPRKDFSRDPKEKAYLMGFRIGDLNVTRHNKKSSVIVKSNTTHLVQLNLMKQLFSKYGPTWSSVTKNNVYNFTTHLNNSFDFLLPKPTSIPHWIFKSQNYFWAFLGGYIDAEGTIRIYQNRARLRVGSYDKKILKQIHEYLELTEIKSSFRLEGKAKPHKQRSDFYRVDIMDRFALYKCLRRLLPYLKHERRYQDAQTAMVNVLRRLPSAYNLIQ